MNSLVPSMLLQPLVENAIRHGLRETGDGAVSIGGKTAEGRLLLEVVDTGGATAPSTQGSGFHIGLANIRARLQHMYGDDFDFVLETSPVAARARPFESRTSQRPRKEPDPWPFAP